MTAARDDGGATFIQETNGWAGCPCTLRMVLLRRGCDGPRLPRARPGHPCEDPERTE